MTINQLIKAINATPLNITDGEKQLKGGYAGDFLSAVMGKAPEHSAWFTIMSNVNVAAVAILTGVGVVVCCEGVVPDDALVKRCQTEGIDIVSTKLDTYSAIISYNSYENTL